MVSKDNVAGLLAVLAGMLIFKATTYIEIVEQQIQERPLIVVVLALGLFFYRKRMAETLGT